MPCDEAFYRHYHKRQQHTHAHQHEDDHQHAHERRGENTGGHGHVHGHVHEEVLHAHPYDHEDSHHQPEVLQVGVSVYTLQERQEQLILEDVDFLEFSDDQVLVHNVLGVEKMLTARLKRIHFVHRDKVMMFLEKG